jgi:hypothetical protein
MHLGTLRSSHPKEASKHSVNGMLEVKHHENVAFDDFDTRMEANRECASYLLALH